MISWLTRTIVAATASRSAAGLPRCAASEAATAERAISARASTRLSGGNSAARPETSSGSPAPAPKPMTGPRIGWSLTRMRSGRPFACGCTRMAALASAGFWAASRVRISVTVRCTAEASDTSRAIEPARRFTGMLGCTAFSTTGKPSSRAAVVASAGLATSRLGSTGIL